MQRRQQILLLAVGIFISILFVCMSWVWGHSYVYFINDSAKPRFYRIVNSAGTVTSFRSSDKVVKRVLKKGTYQFVVQQEEKNYFVIKKTKGLLRSTGVSVALVAEKSRSFVGNNPSPCARYIGDFMFSAECGGSAYRIEKHMPSLGYTPSYSAPLPSNNLYGELAGIVTTHSGDTVALLKDTEGVAGYSLQKISSDLVGTDRVRIGSLDPDYTYSIRPFGEGVLVYETARGNYFYINPTDMSSTRLRPERPTTHGLSFVGVRTYKSDVIALYTSSSSTENLNPENDKAITAELAGTTEVVIYNNQKQSHVVLPHVYSSATTCGKGRLCVIGLTGMAVYDISNEKKPIILYIIPGVMDMFETSSSSLRIVSSLGIMTYDPLGDSGSYDYTFGDYRMCGFSPAANDTYLLCLIDTRQEKIGLLIGTEETNDVVPIDKVVLGVLRSEVVSSVSVYKNLVIVTPRYYDRISGQAIDGAKVKKSLGTVIKKAAFPRGYTVVNSAEL